MTREEAISKVRKLLALSDSRTYNPHEAELAASRATSIMLQFQLDEASISIDPKDEIVGNHVFNLGGPGTRLRSWKEILANNVAKIMGCHAYKDRHVGVRLLGREQDVKSARYLYDMLVLQIEHQSNLAYNALEFDFMVREDNEDDNVIRESPSRIPWTNEFKLGCTNTVCRRMREGQKSKLSSQDPNSQAMIVIGKRLARIDELRAKLGISPGRQIYASGSDAYIKGQRAGNSIQIGGKAIASLNGMKKQISGRLTR